MIRLFKMMMDIHKGSNAGFEEISPLEMPLSSIICIVDIIIE